MSQLAQIEFAGSGRASTPPPILPVPWREIGALGAISLLAYGSPIYHMVGQWLNPNYNLAFIVPVFSGFVLWRERKRLAGVPVRPSWSGLALITVAMGLLWIGQLGAEVFLSRCSMLLFLAGVVVLFLGWSFFRAVFFPLAFLALMVPIPNIVFNEIAFPLQLLASRVASDSLPLFHVPVLQEGNIIQLSEIRLEVATACSGIRSLMSLVTMAIIYGYVTDRRLWVRWLLGFASVPIAVLANSVRIIGTGLLVHYWDAEKAEGYFHASWGVIMFVVSLLLLYALHGVILLLWPDKTSRGEAQSSLRDVSEKLPARFPLRFALAVALVLFTAGFLQAHTQNENIPPRLEFSTFPQQLGSWSSIDLPLDSETREVLGPGDFLLRQYDSEGQASISMFIAYFRSQRVGDTYHSPKNCLPGAGFTPQENRQVTLAFPGHAPFPANRFIVSKGEVRQVVLYWYWAHDRGVANEYVAKYYLIRDSIRMNRSDGSLVRLNTPILPGETADDAEKRLHPLAESVMGLLDGYVPR